MKKLFAVLLFLAGTMQVPIQAQPSGVVRDRYLRSSANGSHCGIYCMAA